MARDNTLEALEKFGDKAREIASWYSGQTFSQYKEGEIVLSVEIAKALRETDRLARIETWEEQAKNCRDASNKYLDGAQRKEWLKAMANLFDNNAAALRATKQEGGK